MEIGCYHMLIIKLSRCLELRLDGIIPGHFSYLSERQERVSADFC